MSSILILVLTFISSFLTSSCAKDSDLLLDQVIRGNEDTVLFLPTTDPAKRTIVITADFDWENIPAAYANANWEITEDIDLENKTISLPRDVILSFKGGLLKNGTLIGDESLIVTNSRNRLFDAVHLSGSYTNEYTFPYWFGAIMDGITDDRDSFVETLNQASTIGAKLLVDKDVFLDVEETGKKSIFLEDNTWIEGINEDTNIIINNLLSPAFYMALTKDITIKKITFLYDQTYDANWGWDSAMHEANLVQLENYMAAKHKVVFPSWSPWSRSPISWRSAFSLEAAKNVLFENVTLKAKGDTADKFMIWGIKLKEQYNPNQSIDSYNSPTSIPENIRFDNLTLDGVIMGIQGVVNGLKANGVKSYRYSDVQSLDGSSIGGSGAGGSHWMPPPHLFYLNPDTSIEHKAQNIEISNTVDYGMYTGTLDVRGGSGYCNSLKLVEGVINARLENYKSFRRDGIWDLGAVTNGVFRNIYSEGTSAIFDSSWGFHNARFVAGDFTNCIFENIIIKDNSATSSIYPWNHPYGNSNKIKNLQLYVNEFTSGAPGPFGIFGSNNTIVNTSLNIKEHSSIKEYSGVIFHLNSILDTGSNNHYEVTVNGWRKIDEDPLKKKVRMVFARSVNPNSNYAKVTDIDNNFIIEQINAIETDKWIRDEIVTPGSGNQHRLNTIIPAGFTIAKIEVDVLEDFATGTEASIGFSTTQKSNLVTNILIGASTITNSFSIENAFKENQNIYLFGNQNFNSTGKIKVSIELIRQSISSW